MGQRGIEGGYQQYSFNNTHSYTCRDIDSCTDTDRYAYTDAGRHTYRYSFADAGGDEALFGDAGYWCAAAQDAIKQILLGQYEYGGEGCGVEDVDGFLAAEGKWLANLSADDFTADKWTEKSN